MAGKPMYTSLLVPLLPDTIKAYCQFLPKLERWN